MIKGSGREIFVCEGQNSVTMPPWITTSSSSWRVDSHIKLLKECNICLLLFLKKFPVFRSLDVSASLLHQEDK